MSDALSWPALLQKTEETLSRIENAFGPRDQLLEIDKVRGVEQAYYEGDLEECENLISKMEADLDNPQDRRHTSPVQGARDAPIDVDEAHMSPRARRLYQQFGDKDEEEGSLNCSMCGYKARDADDLESHIDGHLRGGSP